MAGDCHAPRLSGSPKIHRRRSNCEVTLREVIEISYSGIKDDQFFDLTMNRNIVLRFILFGSDQSRPKVV